VPAVVVAVLVAMATGMVIRAVLLSSPRTLEPRIHVSVDAAGVARHLSGAIRFQTVSGANAEAFSRLREYLAETYPQVHARLVHQTVNGLSLLYEWKGKDQGKAPAVFMGHLDVVPVVPASEREWTHPPYSGAILDGFVYGRGALDDKSAVIAVLEAVEQLLHEGFEPTRTIYLAFGADEEIGGTNGAQQIMRMLQARNISEPAIVLDEGGSLMEGQVPGVVGPAALIGIAEKGYVSLELSVHGAGGHSSTPRVPTEIGRLSAAIARLEATQFPPRLEAPTLEMLRAIAPVQAFGRRLVLANLWLFGPLVARQLVAYPDMATVVHTTTAPTIFAAGDTENVLPSEARAIVNFQILPGDTVASVIARVTAVVADPATKVQVRPGGLIVAEPSPVSDVSGSAFHVLTKTVQQTLGETPPLIVPFLTGPTDSRYWAKGGARNVFRFTPFSYEKDWMLRAHGADERISVRALADGVGFFRQLILNAETL
jgi:carboxypeptidase PM20D1